MRKIFFVSFTIFITILFSCDNYKSLNIEFDYKPVPVVYSLFSPDEVFEVAIVWSLNPQELSPEIDTIKNADVVLFKNGDELGKMTYSNEVGKYVYNNYYPEVGQNYSIQIDIPNYEHHISANSIIPNSTDIKNIEPNYIDVTTVQKEGEEVTKGHLMYLDDRDKSNNKKHYAYFPNIVYGVSLGWKLKLTDLSYDKSKDFYETLGGSSIFLFDNRYFVDGKTEIELTSIEIHEDIAEGITISQVELLSISEEMYLYYASAGGFYRGGVDDTDIIPSDAYSDPKITYSNIIGADGLFAGYSKSIFEIELKK